MSMAIALSIPKGERLAITGPSGAGKTTLLRQIAGLSHPQRGTIIQNSQVWLDSSQGIFMPPQKRNIGFVFQDYALFPHLTVIQNLSYGLPKGKPTPIVDRFLRRMELSALAHRRPSQLSGGQQQRVALARALVREPELLLLDEPLSALDSDMRHSLQNLLLELQHEQGFTMILVTHHLGEIFKMAQSVVQLNHGQITASGSPVEVYPKRALPADSLTLYGEVLIIEIQDDHLRLLAWIDHQVRELKLPLEYRAQLQLGQAFTLTYQHQQAVLAPL
ncbi:molybdate transport system ATP-binding protein [Dyadobacter jejuensis]|uniref:Molybdate transport system ATP-binding protein n=2 Tax=Dyadobacter jejuensis TaxID=1082580 RepID=A0A316AQL2_9BACT|nr:molybdate transport system ATP-binding protein [Dyadobacter jejuensis]